MAAKSAQLCVSVHKTMKETVKNNQQKLQWNMCFCNVFNIIIKAFVFYTFFLIQVVKVLLNIVLLYSYSIVKINEQKD